MNVSILEPQKTSVSSHRLRAWGLISALALTPLVSAAQGVSLASGFTDFTTWNRFGSALADNQTPGNGFTYSTLILTNPGIGGSAGAGFAPDALTLDFNQSFTFDFRFFIPAGPTARGDGLTFTLAGTPGVGNGGSGLGYKGLSADSLAIAVDTFNFDGEPVSPSLQVLQGGSVSPLAFTETGIGDGIRDPNFQWLATVLYTPSGNDDETGVLEATIAPLTQPNNLGIFAVSAPVDLSGLGAVVQGGHAVFFGFTASSGLADDGHFITSAMPTPIPLPAGLWLLSSALAGTGFFRRRRA